METLSAVQLVFCAMVVTTAFAVRGGTGFGASTVAIPLLAFAMPLPVAVPVISLLIIGNSVGLIAREWRHMAWRPVLATVPFSAIGVLLGLFVLLNVDEMYLLRTLGVIIVVYGLGGLITRERTGTPAPRWRSMLAATTGLTGGSLGALFGAGVGPIYAMYLNVLNLDKRVFRVSVSTVILFQLVFRVLGYAGLGYYARSNVLLALVAAIPFMLVGTWLGDKVLRHLDKRRFGQVVSVLLVVSGSCLVIR